MSESIPGMGMDDEIPDTVERAQELLGQELKLWQVNQLPPPQALNPSMNVLNMDIQIQAIIRCLIDKLEIEKEEFDLVYSREKLRILRICRKQLMEARIMHGVHGPNGQIPPDIQLPWNKG